MMEDKRNREEEEKKEKKKVARRMTDSIKCLRRKRRMLNSWKRLKPNWQKSKQPRNKKHSWT